MQDCHTLLSGLRAIVNSAQAWMDFLLLITKDSAARAQLPSVLARIRLGIICDTMAETLGRQLAACEASLLDAAPFTPRPVQSLAPAAPNASSLGVVSAARSALAVEVWEAQPFLDEDAWEAWMQELAALAELCGCGIGASSTQPPHAVQGLRATLAADAI